MRQFAEKVKHGVEKQIYLSFNAGWVKNNPSNFVYTSAVRANFLNEILQSF